MKPFATNMSFPIWVILWYNYVLIFTLNRKHGIFHLTEPCGMGVIHDCDATGFHPHEEPLDGTPIYEHCSHVYMNPNVRFEMTDLREAWKAILTTVADSKTHNDLHISHLFHSCVHKFCLETAVCFNLEGSDH